MTSSLAKLHDHTQDTSRSVGPLWTSDQPEAETSTWQHTALTRDRRPCPRRDSNPQSQQAKGRRSTPQTARSLRSAVVKLINTLFSLNHYWFLKNYSSQRNSLRFFSPLKLTYHSSTVTAHLPFRRSIRKHSVAAPKLRSREASERSWPSKTIQNLFNSMLLICSDLLRCGAGTDSVRVARLMRFVILRSLILVLFIQHKIIKCTNQSEHNCINP